jgi:hypothetical protein
MLPGGRRVNDVFDCGVQTQVVPFPVYDADARFGVYRFNPLRLIMALHYKCKYLPQIGPHCAIKSDVSDTSFLVNLVSVVSPYAIANCR